MDYICDRDTFLKVREAQIEMMNERRSGDALLAYNRAYDMWRSMRPKEEPERLAVTRKAFGARHYETNPKYAEYKVLYDNWRKECPPNPENKFTAYAARHLNIFYAILKGKTYSQVESKVREGNEFNIYNLEDLCKTYNVDFKAFRARLV